MPTPEDLNPEAHDKAKAETTGHVQGPTDHEDALAFLGGRKFVLTTLALVFVGTAALSGKLPMADAGQWGAAILASYLGVNIMQGRRK